MTSLIGRREFITLLAAAAAAWPLAVRAQQAGKLPTIGFLGTITPAVQIYGPKLFVQRLGRTRLDRGSYVAIEYRWAEGRTRARRRDRGRVRAAAGGCHYRRGDPISRSAKLATSVIPIVFPIAGTRSARGLVASLARPGGNVTGLSNQGTDPLASELATATRCHPDFADWRSWPMSTFRRSCRRCARFRSGRDARP